MQIIKYKAYEFNELNDESKLKAINEQICCEIELADENSMIWDSIKSANDMQTPWFASEYVYEMHKDYIIEICENYLYFKDGEIVPYNIYKED